jgi:hypothetical protein
MKTITAIRTAVELLKNTAQGSGSTLEGVLDAKTREAIAALVRRADKPYRRPTKLQP